MKKIFLIICCFTVSLSLFACVKKDEKQEKCLKDLKVVVESDFKIASGISVEEDLNTQKVNIDNQLSKLSKYKNVKFEDKTFKKNINKYIEALESKSGAIDMFFSDANQFYDKYYVNGYDVEIKCLKELNQNFNFNVSEKYDKRFKKYIKGEEIRWIPVGMPVTVKTKFGKVNVQIDHLKKMDWQNMGLESGYSIAAVEYTIKNISYKDEDNDWIRAQFFLKVMDSGYFADTLFNMSSTSPYEYDVQAGGLVAMPTEDEKIKAGAPYLFKDSQTNAIVQIGDKYRVFLNLE